MGTLLPHLVFLLGSAKFPTKEMMERNLGEIKAKPWKKVYLLHFVLKGNQNFWGKYLLSESQSSYTSRKEDMND